MSPKPVDGASRNLNATQAARLTGTSLYCSRADVRGYDAEVSLGSHQGNALIGDVRW